MTTAQTADSLFRPTYRLIGFSLVAEMFGATAALGFDALVDISVPRRNRERDA